MAALPGPEAGGVGRERVIVTRDFLASQPGDLTLIEGDEVTDVQETDSVGWWRGTNPRGERGVFPNTYVELEEAEVEEEYPGSSPTNGDNPIEDDNLADGINPSGGNPTFMGSFSHTPDNPTPPDTEISPTRTSETENLQKTSEYAYKGHDQPAPDVRLNQAKRFLGDEDQFRCLGFTSNLKEIEEYLRFLQGSELLYSRELFIDVRNMVNVHHLWAQSAKPRDIDIGFLDIRPSNRLLTYEDLETAKSMYKDTLCKLPQAKGVPAQTDLAIPLWGDQRPKEPDPFHYTKALAELRRKQDNLGYSFKMLDEMRHHGDASYVPAPANYLGPFLPARKCLVDSGCATRQRQLMNIVKKLLDAEKISPRPALRDVLVQCQRAMCFPQKGRPDLEYEPVNGWTDEEKKDNANLRAEIASEIGKLEGKAKRDGIQLFNSDTSMSKVDIDNILILTEKSWNASKCALTLNKRVDQYGYTVPQPDLEQYSRLLLFAERVEQVRFMGKMLHNDASSATETELVDAINAIDEIPGMTSSSNGTTNVEKFSVDEARDLLKHMKEANRVRLEESRSRNGSTQKLIRYAYLDAHPEDRFVPDHTHPELTAGVIVKYNGAGDSGPPLRITDPQKFQRLGWKLGRNIRDLTYRMASDSNKYGEQAPAAERLKNHVKYTADGQPRRPTLRDIAAPLYAEYVMIQRSNKEEIEPDNETTAARLLDWKIGEEMCNNDTMRSPDFDFENLWSFCANKSPFPKKYFDLRRWPVELQVKKVQREIRNSGPRPALKPASEAEKRRAEHDEVTRRTKRAIRGAREAMELEDTKEKWHPGRCAFPFGETKWQQAWLSMNMDEDLKDAPEFAHLYKKKKSWVNSLYDAILGNKATTTPAKSANSVDIQPPRITWDAPKNLDWEETARGLLNNSPHSRSAAYLNPSDLAKTPGKEKDKAQKTTSERDRTKTDKKRHQGTGEGILDSSSGWGPGTAPHKPSTQSSAARDASEDVYMSGGLGEQEGGE